MEFVSWLSFPNSSICYNQNLHWRYQFKLTSTFKLMSHPSHYPMNQTWTWLADVKVLSTPNTLLNAFVPCFIGALLLQSSGHDLYRFTFPTSSVLRVCSTNTPLKSNYEKEYLAQICLANVAYHISLLEKHNVYSYIKALRNPAAKIW